MWCVMLVSNIDFFDVFCKRGIWEVNMFWRVIIMMCNEYDEMEVIVNVVLVGFLVGDC